MIRKMKLSDFAGVNRIFAEVQELHVKGRPDIFIEKDPLPITKFKERLHSRKIIKLVSVDENKKVNGFVFAELHTVGGEITHKRKVMSIHEIGVDAHNRGTGIGTKLFEDVKKIATDKRCDDINLSVWQFNEKAINFYKKLGFEVQSMRMEFKI